MLTEKDYCDYETSRELKELGFVAGLGEDNCGHCLYDDAWHDQVDRPLLYEAQKFLREEKNIHIQIHYSIIKYKGKDSEGYSGDIFRNSEINPFSKSCCISGIIYEEVLLGGIKEAIKILKDEKTN